MRGITPRQGRQRGNIEELPSGGFRVGMYAGIDPLTKKRHDLRETVPAGPGAARDAQTGTDTPTHAG
ncbi:hypothetical protein E1269_09110 [Jiangella asiatica]|uniref:Integrase n=1 Tax=Jiangella asiatica TaxID=2530372 RepID=A0A4V2Z363_9ACTN|nr:hypothetical protein E1269_09110 [Jiangella asiatica]